MRCSFSNCYYRVLVIAKYDFLTPHPPLPWSPFPHWGRLGESAYVTLGFPCDTSACSFRLLLRKIHLPLGGRLKESRFVTYRKAPCGGSWRRRRLRESADVTFKPSPVGSEAARECKKTTKCCFPSSVTESQRERWQANA